MELDHQSLHVFGLHVHSYTHRLRPRNPLPPPHLGSYTRALLVSQDRRHLFMTPEPSPCFCDIGIMGINVINTID